MLRRSLALAVLAAVTAAPAASAGCVEDYLAPRPNPFVMPADPVEVSVGGGAVYVGSPWAYGKVQYEAGRLSALVDCIV